MRKFYILRSALLAIVFISLGCGRTQGVAAPSSGSVSSPSISSDSEGKSTEEMPLDLKGEKVSAPGGQGTIQIQLPDSWECVNIWGNTNGEYGMEIRPKEVSKGCLRLTYEENFGVCGTGLDTQEITLAGDKASVGTYDNRETWDYISFQGKNSGIVARADDAEEWMKEYGKEAMAILDTLEFGGGFILLD